MDESKIVKVWTEGAGSYMYFFALLGNGSIYCKSSPNAETLARAKWHRQCKETNVKTVPC